VTPGKLTAQALDEMVRARDIDTVLVVFPDLQGRLMGKRVTGHYWVDEMGGGRGEVHACNYLLAVDSEMTVLPGYRFANWEQGYGDFAMKPDLNTIRRIPWLEKTALVMCDLADEHTGEPIAVSPRAILRRQVERAAAMGYSLCFASELEFLLFREGHDDAAAKGYGDLTPMSNVVLDYHILQTTRDEEIIRAIRNGMDGAGVPVEFSKGEAELGQHEINLKYADPLEMADRHVIYKNGVKEIVHAHGKSVTFMAKYAIDKVGSSCHIHSSVWDAAGTKALMWSDDAPDHLSDVFRGWLGGIAAAGREFAWMFAPTVNSYKRYQPDSWAPTALVWGADNRTCGYRLVGHGGSYRLESRIPGADCNPYLAFAATIAAGLDGIERGVAPPPRFEGNAYTAPDVPRVPWTLVEAIDAFEGSELAKKAFGDDVHYHLLNTAKQEWASFNAHVTDWERRRNFDQW
jgi:glutamine synthetase